MSETNPISDDCVHGCKGHKDLQGNWRKVTIAGDGGAAKAGVYEVAIAGRDGTATSIANTHGIVSITAEGGHAISGDGGVAVSSTGGKASVTSWGVAHSKGGVATSEFCGVASTVGGKAMAGQHGIGVGWTSSVRGSEVSAGPGGIAIGNEGCRLKVGLGGALIAMAVFRKLPQTQIPTRIWRVTDGEVKADTWYEVVLDESEHFQLVEQKREVPSA